MVAWFPAPRSFTGEDVAELHVHGGRAVLQGVLGALAKIDGPGVEGGVRMAQRGEFTRRAFENGKIDLLQAEALADVVSADTEAQLQQALRQAGGQVSARYGAWRFDMLGLLARTEACIDFGDDEEDVDAEEIVGRVRVDAERLRREIRAVLRDNRGVAIRDGVSVAIVGPPNAGKSSLLNRLAGRDAAIVSDMPGTTRDVVEVRMNLGGVAVVMQDTAGVRDLGGDRGGGNDFGEDMPANAMAVEGLGIDRAKTLAKEADFLLCVFDAKDAKAGHDRHARAVEQIERIVAERGQRKDDGGRAFVGACGRRDVLVAMNKVDLLGNDAAGVDGAPEFSAASLFQATPSLGASLASVDSSLVHYTTTAEEASDNSISQLCGALEASIVSEFDLGGGGGGGGAMEGEKGEEATYVTRERHRVHLHECEAALSDALDNLTGNDDQLELAVEDLRLAGEAIGAIGGGVGVEDVLDRLFLEFCLGK